MIILYWPSNDSRHKSYRNFSRGKATKHRHATSRSEILWFKTVTCCPLILLKIKMHSQVQGIRSLWRMESSWTKDARMQSQTVAWLARLVIIQSTSIRLSSSLVSRIRNISLLTLRWCSRNSSNNYLRSSKTNTKWPNYSRIATERLKNIPQYQNFSL